MTRLPVRKTYKLFVGGDFAVGVGRTYEAQGQNVARASRKDVRDAVRAARAAFGKWRGMTAYNRGQVLYRIAEMMESRKEELAELSSGRKEVESAVDRWVWYAGWADSTRRFSALRTRWRRRTSTSRSRSRPAWSGSLRRTSRRWTGSSAGWHR